jgi:hypothetical protein
MVQSYRVLSAAMPRSIVPTSVKLVTISSK